MAAAAAINKDAAKLARLLRAGELVSVHVPDETDEAIRDLCRARVDAHDDLRRAKTRLLAMLRRLGFHYSGKTRWSEAHKRYLRELKLPFPAHRIILEELIGQIDQLDARIERLEAHMEILCADWSGMPVVDAVMALKGFKLIAAMMIVSEVGDFVRFTHPRQLMSYLGLTPGEYSSGGKSASKSNPPPPDESPRPISRRINLRPAPAMPPTLIFAMFRSRAL